MHNTLLVTGGCGFIGSCFVRRALVAGNSVINLDKQTYAATTSSVPPHARYQLVRGDIADGPLVESLLHQHQPQYVVNFAAESHVDRSIDDPAAFVMTNVVGTFQLLNATLGWWQQQAPELRSDFRFLHVSTDEVYGSLGPSGLFREDTQYQPNSPYSASKAASDHFVRAYHHTFGLPVLTTNCSNNYGPYQFPEKLIPLVTLNALAGKPLPVYGDGSNIRDWLYVEDHCRAIEMVMAAGQVGEVYNVGGDSERTNLQVVQTICDVIDELTEPLASGSRRGLITFVKDRPGHDQRYAIDCSKLKSELGWTASQSFESGLRRTIKWYLEHPEWIDEARQGYVGQRLGLASAR